MLDIALSFHSSPEKILNMIPRKKRILKASADEQTVLMSCPVEFDTESLQATAADGKPKVPTFTMNANTGVPMRVGGFADPLIVEFGVVRGPGEGRPRWSVRSHARILAGRAAGPA